jgi:hypothetical protein
MQHYDPSDYYIYKLECQNLAKLLEQAKRDYLKSNSDNLKAKATIDQLSVDLKLLIEDKNFL